MLFTCSHEHLNHAVALVGRAVSSRVAMPILSNIFIETKKDAVRLAATDLDHGIQTEIPATVKKGGAITMPARLFTEIVANLPNASVQFKVADNGRNIEVQCERTTYDLIGLPAADFPLMPEPDSAPVVTIEAGMLRTMIRQTSFAVSADETRVFLTGLYLVVDGKDAKVVATDGGRLALRSVTLVSPSRQKVGVIVPSKTMQELTRALAGVEGDVDISLAENQILFTLPGARLVSRLIPGPFPNYQQVIPQGHKQKLTVGTERLMSAVRRVAITARDSANVVRLQANTDTLTLSSNTPEYGRSEETLQVAAEGETVPTAFNARYLLDCLGVVEADEVTLELTGPLSPGALRPVGHTDYTYVLAPVRVAT